MCLARIWCLATVHERCSPAPLFSFLVRRHSLPWLPNNWGLMEGLERDEGEKKIPSALSIFLPSFGPDVDLQRGARLDFSPFRPQTCQGAGEALRFQTPVCLSVKWGGLPGTPGSPGSASSLSPNQQPVQRQAHRRCSVVAR